MAGRHRKRQRLLQYGKHSRRGHLSPLLPDMFFPNSNNIDQSQEPPPLPPNKPTSQRAATMPSEPEEGNVQMMMDVTGMPRASAVRYLKAKHNNLEAAMTAYLDGEDISKAESASTWDEGAWTQDRDGNSADQFLRPLASSAAATRPNSPAPSTGGRSNLQPSSKAEEDDDLARAMAMSQGELRVVPQQETGRIGADGQQTSFGPATKEYYERNQWAMVHVGAQESSEIIPDVDVQQRIHTRGEPRMLKQLPGGDYTPNLLTICHAISAAREAFLMREQVQMNYGQDAEWWRGHAIRMPRIVNLEDQTSAQPETDQCDNLLAEVQRLMAFLSASDRSYVSIGALTQTDMMKRTSPSTTRSRTLLELFLQSWIVAASSKSELGENLASIFTTTVGTSSGDSLEMPDLPLIDMPVVVTEGAKSDLFEILDGLLWNTNGDGTTSDNYIERPADILVMRLYQANAALGPQLRVEVPAEFYVDKYLLENSEATRTTRLKMANGKKRIAKIEEIEKKLRTHKHPKKNEQLDAGALLKHTLGHFSGQNRADVLNADKSSYVPEEMKANKPGYQDIAEKLEAVVKSIDDKLAHLAEEKEKTRKAIAEMSKAPPPGLEPEDLTHHYTLRGVATKPNITYVLRPNDESVSDEMLDDDTTPEGMTWWRMEYDVSGSSAKVTKTKSADYDVLRAVELEHSSALLVYASDRANNYSHEDDTLPQPLQDFVYRDNVAFASELEADRNRPPAYEMNDIPHQSIERTSLDSTRVEGGSEYGEYNDDGVYEHHGFGLGPRIDGIKQGYRVEQDDEAPVHEIKLDTPEDEGLDMGTSTEMEMVEKKHEPLIPGLLSGVNDAVMKDATQDRR